MSDRTHKEIEWVATVYSDWTVLQLLDSGMAFGFDRATGKVYKLPHPDCPLVPFTPAKLCLPNAT